MGLGFSSWKDFKDLERWLWYEWVDPSRPWVGTAMSCDHMDKALFHASTMVIVGQENKASLALVMAKRMSTNGHCTEHVSNRMEENKKVKEELGDMNWTMGLLRMDLVQQIVKFVELWDMVQIVQLVDQDNSISWRGTTVGSYPVKLEYLAQFKRSFSPFSSKYN